MIAAPPGEAAVELETDAVADAPFHAKGRQQEGVIQEVGAEGKGLFFPTGGCWLFRGCRFALRLPGRLLGLLNSFLFLLNSFLLLLNSLLLLLNSLLLLLNSFLLLLNNL